MKHKYPFLFVCIFSFVLLNAQQSNFQVEYSYGFSIPIMSNIIQNPAGKYVMTGTNGTLPVHGLIAEIDTDASIVWSYRYVSSIQNEIVDIKNVSAGGYIVAGSSNPGLVLMRIDANANVIWSNTYHFTGTNSNASENASKVLPTSDGGFVVSGYLYGVDPDGAGPAARQDSANPYCLKVNSAGTLLWAKVICPTTAYINDHVFNDVAEVSDGYIFGGNMSQGQADAAGLYGLVAKTDFNGNLQYLEHFGPSGGDAEVTSVTASSGTQVILGGDDGNSSISFFIKAASSSGALSGGFQYKAPGLLGQLLNFDLTPTNDGNYSMVGMYLDPFNFGGQFNNYLMKVNPSTGVMSWGESYNGGFAALFPQGRQVSDSGYIMVMTNLSTALGGYTYLVTKTNSVGSTSGSGCIPSSFTPTKSAYSPSLTLFSPADTLTGSVTNSFTPTRVSSIPTDTIHCITIVCTPPGAPTASASAPSICSGQPSTINASGSGTFNVYTAASGGTLLGATPLVVNPTTTTTYYVEATTGPGCVSTTRTPVTVTVTQAPGSVGAIVGQTSTCLGSQGYSIGAVTNATSYTWSVSGGGNISGGQGSTNITVTWTTTGGPYTVSVTASNSCGNSTATSSVNVLAAPGAASASATSNSICHGSSIQLNGSSTSATSFSWTGPNAFSSTLQNPSIPNATVADSGSYVFTATNICGNSSSTVVVNVDTTLQNISAVSSPSDTLCTGATISLHANGVNVNTWSWTGPNSFTSALQNPTITNATAVNSGQYILTASNACGNVKDTLNILIESSSLSLTASSSVPSDSVCSGQTVNLLATGSFFNSYSWTGPNGYTSTLQNPVLNNATTIQSGTYTVSATNSCGSLSSSVHIQIDTLIRNLSATSSPADTLCTGSTISLHGSGLNVGSWSWIGPNSFISVLQNPTIPNATAANSGQYVLTASNACGNAKDTVNVFIEVSTLTLTASSSVPNDSVCSGQTVNLYATGSFFNTYSWTGPNGFTSNLQNPILNNATTVQSGAYTVTGNNSCGNLSSTVNIQIDTLIQNLSAASSPNDTVCAGTNITLQGSGQNVHNWNWSGPNGFVSTLQNPTIPNSAVGNSGLYILQASNACGNAADSVYVSVENSNQNLTATSSLPGDSACSGHTLNLFANGTFDSYSWTGPGGFSSNQQNPTIPNATVAQAGTYLVQAVNACGNNTASVVINIDTIPQGLQVSTSNNNNTSCQGQSITVSAITTGGNNWVWSGPNGFTSQAPSFTLTNIQPNQQGNYIVTAVNACGFKSDTVYVTVFVLPDSLLVNASSDSICPGVSITLTARQGLGNIVWNTGQTGSPITTNQPGQYYYNAHDSNNCAVFSDTITVYQAPGPVLDLFSTNPSSICAGQQTITLHASSNNNVIVTWTPGGFVGSSLPVTAPGEYTATARLGTCFASDSINVSLAPVPTVSFADSIVKSCCLDFTVSPTVTGTIATYAWSDSSTNATNVFTQSGLYSVTVTTGQGCTATAAFNFNKVCIQAHASATPDTIYVENASQLNVTTNFTTGLTYQWQPYDSIKYPNLINPAVTPTQNTLYTVFVMDSVSGCMDTSTAEVIVLYNNYWGIPNVFSPNDDGNNDTWYVITNGGYVTVQEIKISDRWGDPVFDSQRDATLTWNGKYRGKLQPMGNYVYIVKLKINATGEEKIIKGNLSLIW